MGFKRTIPYFLTSAAMMFNFGYSLGAPENSETQKEPKSTEKNVNIQPKVEKNDSANYELLALNSSTPKIAVDAIAQNYDVVYTFSDGDKLKRSGGTRAWRNNNPGCIRYSSFAIEQGAIGKAGGFAVFPDQKTGKNALAALLRSKGYRNLTISAAIFKYAPPHENNTQNYKARIRKLTGLSTSMKLCNLTDEQINRVVEAICIIEGWRTGKEINIEQIKQHQQAMTDTSKLYAFIQKQNRQNTL